ncbi:methyltransferase domain-containing protein [Streptomyces tubercidicus]
MYSASSLGLAARARLTDSHIVVDLCSGTGATAEAVLALAPPNTQVISLDNAPAMQRIGHRTLNHPRLSWVTAPAEELAEHAPAGDVDVDVCNSATPRHRGRSLRRTRAQLRRSAWSPSAQDGRRAAK